MVSGIRRRASHAQQRETSAPAPATARRGSRRRVAALLASAALLGSMAAEVPSPVTAAKKSPASRVTWTGKGTTVVDGQRVPTTERCGIDNGAPVAGNYVVFQLTATKGLSNATLKVGTGAAQNMTKVNAKKNNPTPFRHVHALGGTSLNALLASPVVASYTGSGTPTLTVAQGCTRTSAPTGTLAGWGLNTRGQLGTGKVMTQSSVDTSGVLAGKTVTSIKTSGSHTCAIAGGRAYCWGSNDSGQLGNGTVGPVPSLAPVAVDTDGPLFGKTVTAIDVGFGFSCAIADGVVYCWGRNPQGQLGNGSIDNSAVPVAVTGSVVGGTATALALGYDHGCTLVGGKVHCWGLNGYGQLGDATNNDSTSSVAVKGPLEGGGVSAISAGDYHSCAIASGAAYCWGANFGGQLGIGSPFPLKNAPTAVAGALGDKTVTGMALGFSHTCVVASDAAFCWGYNYDGQLGDGSNTNSDVPVAVSTAGALDGVTIRKVVAGEAFACAVSQAGAAYCWGANPIGQLGDGTTLPRRTPAAVDTSGLLNGVVITAIDGGGADVCALGGTTPICWGGNTTGQHGNGGAGVAWTPTLGDTSGALQGKAITSIGVGYESTCAVADGSAYCWGVNNIGQLGNGTLSNSSRPVAVGGVLAGATVTAVDAGYGHACALSVGKVYCWGGNSSGQLGNGGVVESSVPVLVGGALSGLTVTALGVGYAHTCAVAGGDAYCWGSNITGQLGNDSTDNSNVPVRVTGLTNVTSLSAGFMHTCALANGAAHCWGSNNLGQLGTGTGSSSLVPAAVKADGALAGLTLTAIDAGEAHTCAIASGTALCWGYNQFGQLGNGEITAQLAPVAVTSSGALNGKVVTAISAGAFHSCAIASGAAYCWGSNFAGEGGTTANSVLFEPTAVDTSGVLSGKTFTAIGTGYLSTVAL